MTARKQFLSDHLGPPSDECLGTRVLEYARDEQVGRDALKALARRGPSAARGVRARLSDLRSHWPPPDYTVKASGIRELLQQLNIYGDHETVRAVGRFRLAARLPTTQARDGAAFATVRWSPRPHQGTRNATSRAEWVVSMASERESELA